jgi:hypothetical protein
VSQRPNQPTPPQPRRRPPTQPRPAHARPPPPPTRPGNPRLHRPPHRRRQEPPRRHPPTQALPRPPPLPTPPTTRAADGLTSHRSIIPERWPTRRDNRSESPGAASESGSGLPVEVGDPAMAAERRQLTRLGWPRRGRVYVSLDVACRAHAGDDDARRRMAEAEPERDLRQPLVLDVQVSDDRLHPFPKIHRPGGRKPGLHLGSSGRDYAASKGRSWN